MKAQIENAAPDSDVIVITVGETVIQIARDEGAAVMVYVTEPNRCTILTLGSSEPAAVIGD